jgi:hypothetical protein
MTLYDESDGQPLWIRSKNMGTITSNEDEAEFVMCGAATLEADSVYVVCHPVDDPDLRPTGPAAPGNTV